MSAARERQVVPTTIAVAGFVTSPTDDTNMRQEVWSFALDQRAFGPRRLLVAFTDREGRLLSLAHAPRTSAPEVALECCLDYLGEGAGRGNCLLRRAGRTRATRSPRPTTIRGGAGFLRSARHPPRRLDRVRRPPLPFVPLEPPPAGRLVERALKHTKPRSDAPALTTGSRCRRRDTCRRNEDIDSHWRIGPWSVLAWR